MIQIHGLVLAVWLAIVAVWAVLITLGVGWMAREYWRDKKNGCGIWSQEEWQPNYRAKGSASFWSDGTGG